MLCLVSHSSERWSCTTVMFPLGSSTSRDIHAGHSFLTAPLINSMWLHRLQILVVSVNVR